MASAGNTPKAKLNDAALLGADAGKDGATRAMACALSPDRGTGSGAGMLRLSKAGTIKAADDQEQRFYPIDAISFSDKRS